ncbi:hypothetical protein BS78_08G161000 [Paspalum vaginatum]|nr:hypothetical protein BS78_08G161000 [Paspalum vaginatum]
MNRRFLNLVTKQWSTLVCSLRRINLATHLFYPSTAAAESAMARRDAAIKANARRRAGHQHGLRSLRAMATTLGRLPAPRINLQHAGHTFGDRAALDFAALLGDESKILCGDTCGCTCLYDADSHSVLTAPSLTRVERPAGGAIAITIRRRAAAGHDTSSNSLLYVMSRNPDLYKGEHLFQELNYGVAAHHGPPVRRWTPLPPPPFLHEFPHADITAHAVVGSTIYVSSTTLLPCTYSFDTVTREWKRMGGRVDAAVRRQGGARPGAQQPLVRPSTLPPLPPLRRRPRLPLLGFPPARLAGS